MSRPFTLPVVIACSAHALLMFGFTPSPPLPPVIKPVEVKPTECPEPYPVSLDEPKIPETDDTSEKPLAEKTAPPPPPASEDRSIERLSPEDLGMEFRPREASRVPVETSIIPGHFDPHGRDPNAKSSSGITGAIVYKATMLDNSPRARLQTSPAYPLSLKNSGITGEVLVEFLVDEHGQVSHPRVVRSTHPEFEAPTLAAVLKWRFEPGTRNMAAVRFRMTVPVKFSLNE